MTRPGRSCPSSYGYSPAVFARPAELAADSLWIVGGLYGNRFALDVLLDRYAREPGAKALVFNGDFHWFDIDQGDFQAIDDAVLSFSVTRGNVETELASADLAVGCGCGYPDWVDEGTVSRSNAIMKRLRSTAEFMPNCINRLASLPMHLRADVGNRRIGIVHGDANSLAGWGFSQEALADAGGRAAAAGAFKASGVQVFASSHTCLPVLQVFGAGNVVVNNGAAGMPNFRGKLFGLATRIAVSPAADSLYGVRLGELYIDAIPLRYDVSAWDRRFLEQWPAGSDAWASYYGRMLEGPPYFPKDALRAA